MDRRKNTINKKKLFLLRGLNIKFVGVLCLEVLEKNVKSRNGSLKIKKVHECMSGL